VASITGTRDKRHKWLLQTLWIEFSEGTASLKHKTDSQGCDYVVVVGLRLPGRGTVPGALTQVCWADWVAANK